MIRRAFITIAIAVAAIAWAESQPWPGYIPFQFIPSATAPIACGATTKGVIYFDTDDNKGYICDGTSYVSVIASVFNGGTNLTGGPCDSNGAANSICIDGTAGTIVFEGSTADAFELKISSTTIAADQTIVSDSSGITFAIGAAEIYDFELDAATNSFFVGNFGNGGFNVNREPAAGTGGSIIVANTNITAMNGSDTVNLVSVSTTNADHTGGTNVLNGIAIGNITGDAQATENAINIGTGWDFEVSIGEVANFDATNNWIFSLGQTNRFWIDGNSEFEFPTGADLAVVGAGQTVNPSSNIVEISAGAAASVLIISAPDSSQSAWLTFICADSNVTFTDSGAVGAANTFDLAGAADFVCSADDTISFARHTGPAAGNARWVEVARSVN